MDTLSNMLNETLVEKQNLSMFITYLNVRLRMIDEMNNAFYYPEEQRTKNVSKLLKQTILVVDKFHEQRESFIKDTDFDPTKIVADVPMDRIAYVIINVNGRKSFTRVEFENIEEFLNEMNKFRMTEESMEIEMETLGDGLSEGEIETLKENQIFINPSKDV